jgi:hypothetical protein
MRYRNEQWATYKVEKKLGILVKLGRLLTVKGYRFKPTRTSPRDGVKWSNIYDYVMVTGENGTARFSGCQWGYGGSGPHLTRDLLMQCGLPKVEADAIAFKSTNLYPVLGTDWIVDLPNHTFARQLKVA